MSKKYTGTEIAVIGMACRLPGANTVNAFWENLKHGVESISFLSDEEILSEGEERSRLEHPAYIKANSYVSDKEFFDSEFFGFRPEEARLMEPQIRIFLEICWNALEDAGYDLELNKNKIGLFAGGTSNVNWINYALRENAAKYVDELSLSHLCNTNFLCSRISNLLNLQGPSLYIDTACSTSLVAIQRASMSLLLRECNMALAGGVTIHNYTKKGYLYKDGMFYSNDGHCRAFDAASTGTIAGEGAGVVLLKKLDHAIRDRDNIHAIIRGSGINNDGSLKMSFSSPSVDGQYKAILKAINMAKVQPESIGYVEAQGTGTQLGDSIEVEALNMAFGKSSKKYCAIGSVKTNIGHIDVASGAAAMIKTVLSLKHKQIPPSLNFNTPNPKIKFNEGPFYVNTQLKDWQNGDSPLRAGVSSFGIGGTNAHIILEEAPEKQLGSPSRSSQLFSFSAKTAKALERNIQAFISYLKSDQSDNFADIAYTLKLGRSDFSHRRLIQCSSKEEAIALLSTEEEHLNSSLVHEAERKLPVFVFTAANPELFQIHQSLYEEEEFYKEMADSCFANLYTLSGSWLLENWEENNSKANQEILNFIHQYSLAKLMMNWGIKPKAVLGKKLGAVVAACISGIFSVDEALAVLWKWSQLKYTSPKEEKIGLESMLIKAFQELKPAPAEISYLSYYLGKEAGPKEQADPQYWLNEILPQKSATSQLGNLFSNKEWFILSFDQREEESSEGQVFSLVASANSPKEAASALLSTIGKLWLKGVEIDWEAFYEGEERYRVSLPTYSFEKIAYPVNVDGLQPIYDSMEDLSVAEAELISLDSVEAMEEALLELWKNFFGKADIDKESDFFDLGGDSLRAMSMIARIHKDFNYELSLQALFDHPNLLSLSKFIFQQREKNQDRRDYTPISQAKQKAHYVLSSAQKRLFFLNEFDKSSLAYNMPGFITLEGELDAGRLQHSIDALIAQHECLRTSLEVREDDIVQIVSPGLHLQLEHYNSSPEDVDKVIAQFIRPFDLSKAPLMRIGLVKFSEKKHLLMVDTHHIISDGISQNLLIRDLATLYKGGELAPQDLQYKDYAEWQQSESNQSHLLQQKEFWLKEFEEERSILYLPTDFPRPTIQSFKGDYLSFELDTESTEGLKRIAEKENATLFMVLLAAFNVFLGKVSNQEDIIVGAPVANRPHTDLANILGMFVNTLPLRNFPKAELSFQAFLSKLKARTLACFENQLYQYEDLIDELKLERETSRNALFDVLFVFQNMEEAAWDLPAIKASPYAYRQAVSKFDLSLEAKETKDKILLTFTYATSLFERASIKKFVAYFNKIIQAILADIQTPISQIEILSSAEKQKLLLDFNSTEESYPRHKTIKQVFEEQVLNSPNRVALVYQGEQITFSELNEKANQLANFILQKTQNPEARLGIMMDKSPDMIISVLGILKAGKAFVPIDPTYPESRIAYILADAKVDLVLSNSKISLPDLPTEQKIEFVLLDEAWEGILSQPTKDLPERGLPDSNIYVIYTSGTTGNPKGVMISNKNLLNYMLWVKRFFQLSEESKTVLINSFAFDGCYTSLFGGILFGGELHLISDETYLEADSFLNYLARKEISYLKITPSMYALFVDNPALKKARAMRKLIIGGEQMRTEDVKKTFSILEELDIINHYGPTETTIGSIAQYIDPEKIDQYTRVPSIGKPIFNTKCYILGDNMNLLPIGTRGELYISGEGVGMGYVGKEDLSKQKFIENPFCPGEKMYKTGDIAHWLANGNIYFHGRKDHQVKIRGYRIESGEIESRLLSHPDLQEACVVIKEREGDKFLIAYYTSAIEVPSAKLKDFLAKDLPNYMIPAFFVHLDKLPLNSNGKVDRKRLPAPNLSAVEETVKPVNQTQRELLQIWARILGIEEDKIGIHTNFFDIGGNSLKLVKLANSINQHFKTDVKLVKLFNYPIISSLAEYLLQEQDNSLDFDLESDFDQMNSTIQVLRSDNN